MPHETRLRSALLVVLVGLFICATGWVVFTTKPEIVNKVSDDGLLYVAGTSQNAKSLYVASNVGDLFTTYTLSPEALARQALLTIEYTGPNQLFVYDVDRAAWRAIENIIDSQGHTVFAAGPAQQVDLANYDTWFDEVLTSAPEHAVAYEQFITYQVDDALPHYLAKETVKQVSCGEAFYRTRHVEEHKDTKDVRIPVDGVNNMVHLVLTTRWFINSSGEQCEFTDQE